MADNTRANAGSGGDLIATDEVVDGTLGTVKVQYVKLMDGTLDGTTKAAVGANGLAADVKASALPTGAATSANQTTANSSLSSIDGKVPALGQALAAASVPVILPSATVTTLTPPAAITNFANETGGNLAAIKADVDKIPALGQALAAGSVPVVLTTAQITTLTPPTNTGYALDASLSTIDTDLKANITLHAGTNTIGGVVPVGATTGGLSVYSASVGATATSIKGSAGQVYGWYIDNPNAAVSYIQFFNLATGSVTLGTTPPFFSIGVPANGGTNISFPQGIAFGTAITYACTTTRAGLTGPVSTVDVNVFYV